MFLLRNNLRYFKKSAIFVVGDNCADRTNEQIRLLKRAFADFGLSCTISADHLKHFDEAIRCAEYEKPMKKKNFTPPHANKNNKKYKQYF